MTVTPDTAIVADPTTAAGATTDTAGATQPTATTPAPTDTPAPLFVAQTQAELDAKFGQTRTEGDLRYAKSQGFDTVEAFNAAVATWKTAHAAGQTDAQKATEAQEKLERDNTTLRAAVAKTAMDAEQIRIAAEIGLDPTKIARVEGFRTKNEAEVNSDGTVNGALVQHSMTTFLAQNPEFKAPTVTIGVTGTPADAAKVTSTLDERITAAQTAGKVQEAIDLQMEKMFAPAVIT